MQPDVLSLLLNNVRPPEEREGDLGAQIAACHTGAERRRELCLRTTESGARSAPQSNCWSIPKS
jgi:N-methylhydantoinase B